MIHTHTHSLTLGLADIQERHKAFAQAFEFVSILGIGIIDMLEGAGCIDIVTGVHTHLVGITCCSVGNRSIEMHIGNKRHTTTACYKLLLYATHIDSLTVTLCSKTHKFAALLHNAQCLLHTTLGIHRACICHGLYTHRMSRT